MRIHDAVSLVRSSTGLRAVSYLQIERCGRDPARVPRDQYHHRATCMENDLNDRSVCHFLRCTLFAVALLAVPWTRNCVFALRRGYWQVVSLRDLAFDQRTVLAHVDARCTVGNDRFGLIAPGKAPGLAAFAAVSC